MPRRTQPFRREELTYAAEDVQVAAALYFPEELKGPAPAIVYCPGEGDEIRTMEFLLEALARHGYETLAIAYRGNAWDSDDDDVAAAIDYLEQREDVDRQRIGLVGHFRGGSAALRTAGKDERIKSVVSLAAPVFLAQWVSGTKNFDSVIYQERVEMLGGPPEGQEDRYQALSPLFHCHTMKRAPVLLIHGTADQFVPLDQSLWMYKALGHSGNPNVRLEMPIWGNHYFDHAMNGSLHEHVAELVVSWLDETLNAREA